MLKNKTGNSKREKTSSKTKDASKKDKPKMSKSKRSSGNTFNDTLAIGNIYHAILNQALDAVFIHNADGKFIEVNDKACESLGYTREELLDMCVTDVEKDFDHESAKKEWLMKKQGEFHTLPGRHRKKDGTIFPVEVRLGAFYYDNEKYFLGLVKDVTEQRKMEEERGKVEERYKKTLDGMLEGVQIIGFDWKYVYLNDAADIQNKRPKEELLGKVYTDMWPGVEKTEVYAIMKRCMEERIPHQFENLFLFPDGSEGWYEISVQPVPEGIFILSVDITKRKLAEESYRESREQFYGLYKNSKDAILLTVPDGDVLAANDGACRMFQMTE